MKKIYVLLFFAVSVSLQAQWMWDFGVTAGMANYLGDIGGKDKTRRDFISDVKLAETRWNFGGFARYKFRPKLSLKLAIDQIRIQGDDALSSNPGRRARNFNFRNDLWDMELTAEYFFYENNDLGNTYRYRNGFRAYVFGGVGALYSNPKTFYQGQWVATQPLMTEGQASPYSHIVAAIPMGAGFYFTFNKKHRLGFEMNYRKTFTDYLDDISGNYPTTPPSDPYLQGLILRSTQFNATTPQEKAAKESHVWGAKRGDSGHKDSYISISFSYSYVLRGKSSFYRTRNSGFFSKKRKMRKIRAKF